MGKYSSNYEYLAIMASKNSKKVNDNKRKEKKTKRNLQKIEPKKLLELLTMSI